MMRRGLAVLAGVLLLLPAARSSPLGKDGCAQLKVEQGELERAGTRASMSRGPQWAKNNLEPAKLEQIKRMLEIDEQLLFRCGGRPLVNLPQDPDPDPAARDPNDKAAKAPQAVPKAQKKGAARKAAAAPAADQAAKEPVKKAATDKAAAAPAKAAAAPQKPAQDKGEAGADKKDPAKAAAKKAKAKPKEPASGSNLFTFQ